MLSRMEMGIFFADTVVGCWYYKFLGACQTDVVGCFFFADTGVGCWYYKFLVTCQTDVDVFFRRHRSWMLVLQMFSNMSNRCRWAFFSLSQKCINNGADTLNCKQHKPSDPKQHLRRCHRCYSVTIHYIMLTMRPHTERIWTTC